MLCWFIALHSNIKQEDEYIGVVDFAGTSGSIEGGESHVIQHTDHGEGVVKIVNFLDGDLISNPARYTHFASIFFLTIYKLCGNKFINNAPIHLLISNIGFLLLRFINCVSIFIPYSFQTNFEANTNNRSLVGKTVTTLSSTDEHSAHPNIRFGPQSQ